MSEIQQFYGERWTKQTKTLLNKLGWCQVGSSNFDIPCINKSAHGSKEDTERKNDHGIDLLYKYYDPFLGDNLNIIVESKKRNWAGVTKSNIESFLKQVLQTMECADISEKIQQLGVTGVRNGLLMIWCDETEQYNYEKVKEYLSDISVSGKRSPKTIYVATNNEILRWVSLVDYKERIEGRSESFEFFYPSSIYGKKRSIANQKSYINLIQLFSSYIFAKSTKIEHHSRGTNLININHVFYFAEPTKEELNIMYKLVSEYFQFESADELHIHFYGEQVAYREAINEFIRTKRDYIQSNSSTLKIEYSYMNEFKTIPEDYFGEE